PNWTSRAGHASFRPASARRGRWSARPRWRSAASGWPCRARGASPGWPSRARGASPGGLLGLARVAPYAHPGLAARLPLATVVTVRLRDWTAPTAWAVLGKPSLWPTAVHQVRVLAPRGWWRRRPWLPVPDPDYLRFRLVTQYGDPEHAPEPA